MKKHTSQILALLLAVVLCLGLIVPAGAADRSTQDLKFEQVDGMAPSKLSPSQLDAADEEQTDYAADDIVRVSIVLKDASTIEKFGSAKLSSSDFSQHADVSAETAARLRRALKQGGDSITSAELAVRMGITTRSVNRILSSLEEAGYGATVGKRSSGKGRPARVMKISLPE